MNWYNYETWRTKPISRNTDPSTSYQSDKELTLSGKRKNMAYKLAECVKSFEGHTSREIARKFSLDAEICHKRLPDARDSFHLVKNGEKKRCEVTGKLAMTWYDVANEKICEHGVHEDNLCSRCYEDAEIADLSYCIDEG